MTSNDEKKDHISIEEEKTVLPSALNPIEELSKFSQERIQRERSFDELNGTEDVLYKNGEPVIRTGSDVSRFIVSDRDDRDTTFTFRAFVLGSIFTAFSSVITVIYQFKPLQQTVQVSAVFLMLLVYAAGLLWANFTPSPDRFPSLRPILQFVNSGQPFMIKEHVVASLIATSGNNGLVGTEIFAVERLYYNHTVSATTAVLGTFSITLCGFVVAGVLRKLIVYPSEMVYWSTLPQVVLFQSLHFNPERNKKRLKRFGYVFGGSALWEIFPSYIIPWFNGLSIFCLASLGASTKTRSVFTTIFGGASGNEGLGLFNISLDWQYIQSTYMSYPLKQQANSWVGIGIMYICISALYYGNAFNAKTFPFMSTSLYTSDGSKYKLESIFGSSTTIDLSKLEEYGLPHLTAATIWGYMTAIMAIGALISHVLLFYGKDLFRAVRKASAGMLNDVHYQKMRVYKEVPMWWYGILFILAFVAGIIVNAKGETSLTVGAYILSLTFGAVIAPFSCILYGLFGTGVDTRPIFKMLAAAIQHGKPLANLYFSSWSHQVVLLAVNLSNWLKVGQYTKIPHRVMFLTQIYASLLGAALNYAIMTVIVTSKKEELLDSGSTTTWSGLQMANLNTQAVTWALAKELYGYKSPYFIVPMSLLIGLGLPILHYLANKIFPRLRSIPIVTPIIISSAGTYYAGNTSMIWSTIAVGVISQVWLRRRYPGWFNRYNYLIGAALDGGAQTVIFILSFAVFGAAGKSYPFPTYFGNPSGNPDHCLSLD